MRIWQAIETKFHGPTDTRGSRVSATCQGGRIMWVWDRALGVTENHRAAAVALCSVMNWLHDGMIGGRLPGGSYVWVFVK